jgi:hypothetical protein
MMTKSSCLFTIAILLTFTLHAQTYVSFSTGANFPGGNLGAEDTETLGSEFAKTGVAFDLTMGKFLYKRLALESTFRYQHNNFDKTVLQGLGTVSADPWQSFCVLLGPSFEFPIYRKWLFNLKAQGGYFRTTSHEIMVSGYFTTVTIDQKPAGTFSGLFGFGVKHELTERLTIGIKTDYLMAEQSCEATRIIHWNQVGNEQTDERKYHMDMHSINAQVAITYNFKGVAPTE